MIEVLNKHAAHVAGVAPGAVAHVTQETADRYPWALVRCDGPEPFEAEHEPEGAALPARDQIQALRESDDPEYVREFVGDGRSSVHAAAVRRLRQLTGS
jgi:hypothetical protein